MIVPRSIKKRLITLTTIVVLLALNLVFNRSSLAQSDNWNMTIMPQLLIARYNDSVMRDSLSGGGVFLIADYLDSGGISAGFNFNRIEGKSGNPDNFDNLEEQVFYVSGRYHSYPDSIPGKLTWRLDSYFVDDTSSIVTTINSLGGSNTGMGGMSGGSGGSSYVTYSNNTAFAINPIIAYMNYAKTFALELGYAYSQYDYNDSAIANNEVHQIAPSVGFSFNEQYDWIQLRAFFMHMTDTTLTAGKSDTSAVTISWTHWLGQDAPLLLHQVGIDVLAGKRLFAIDSDAVVIYSLSDQENASFAVHAQWRLSESSKLLAQLGYQEFTDLLLDDDYTSLYTYFNYSYQW